MKPQLSAAAIHSIPSDVPNSGDGRLAHTLDAESGDLIEHCSAMLELVINGAAVPAEGPAAAQASKLTTFAPPRLVESKPNDPSPRRFCSQRTR